MRIFKIVLVVISVVLIGVAILFYKLYQKYQAPIVALPSSSAIFFIPTNSDYHYVLKSLYNQGFVKDTSLLNFVAELKKYPQKVKPGRYRLQNEMNANQLVNMLRSGRQDPVMFTFNNIRFLPKLAGLAAAKLELDSAKLMSMLTNRPLLDSIGFTPETAIALFIPNTYEFFWNTSELEFVERMHKEYKKFWSENRTSKAMDMSLSPIEVSILASIIQEETNKTDEMSRMAGVLVNRLRRNMKLQADPTARYAYGDFSVKRILTDYTLIESPYNTYHIFGLPPDPICMPEQKAIDAVLNFEKNSYLYYCARADGSGYHEFAENHSQHIRNANAYHSYLRKLNIRR
ncbi:MAG: endolytic transglycosylase MltG [Bacteroidales bacterium]|nr:endolytic transglycosylase MltG [Bacteroidales bacterium]